MSHAVSLSLTLGAGLYRASGPVVLKRGLLAVWGRTEVFVAQTVSWDLNRERTWRQSAHWALHFASTYRFPYGLRLEAGRRHPYGDLRINRTRLAAPYGEPRRVHTRQIMAYADLAACRQSMVAPYWLTQALAASHRLGYDVTDVNPVSSRSVAPWSVLDDVHLQAVMNNPELAWNGRTIRIVQAALSCDEESPVWIGQVEIADLADFAAIGIGDSITLTLGLETFVLVVDGKTLSRDSATDQRCEVSAVSPIALLDAPFAATMRYYQPGAVSAEDAVMALIGGVSWQLPAWIIPAGRLMLEGVTPLAAARNIVAAIGGIIESNPDGSVVCRRRHPVSVPRYGDATVAHSLFDSDVISARAQIAPMRGFNRVTLANEEGGAGSASDRVEYVPDPDDARRGTVRAYLAASRQVLLTHTWNMETVITRLGETTRSETETVEFIEGRSSTRYPVTAMGGASWQHTDLGEVTAEGTSLVAAVVGYSLLRVTYTTTSLDWQVALPADEEVQFVLVDA